MIGFTLIHVKQKDLPELNNMMKNAKEIGFEQKVDVFYTFIFSLHLFDQK